MRRLVLGALAPMALMACGRSHSADQAAARASAASAPHPPVALYGTWVSSSDTLVLLPDSVAHGRDRNTRGLDVVTIAVTRWRMEYRSTDPVDSRRDVNGGRYQDGGDLKCSTHPDASCVSAPELCLGNKTDWDCMGFRFHGDSLALSNGAKYRRGTD